MPRQNCTWLNEINVKKDSFFYDHIFDLFKRVLKSKINWLTFIAILCGWSHEKSSRNVNNLIELSYFSSENWYLNNNDISHRISKLIALFKYEINEFYVIIFIRKWDGDSFCIFLTREVFILLDDRKPQNNGFKEGRNVIR